MSLVESTSADRLSLDIPLDPAYILIARLFAGGVARSLELGEETADVLRLTLSEICSEAIARRRGGRIVIDVLSDTNPIRVAVATTGVRGERTHEGPIEATFQRTLVEALAPDATFVEEPDGLRVSFTL